MRVFAEDDIGWMYASYKKGAFGPVFPPGLSGPEFREEAARFMGRQQRAWTVMARMRGSQSAQWPIGLVAGVADGHKLFPHALWYPWASERNILEGVLGFLRAATDAGYLVIIPSGDKYRPFFTKLMRYGILKRVGVIPSWFSESEAADQSHEGPGTDAMFFYARKKP